MPTIIFPSHAKKINLFVRVLERESTGEMATLQEQTLINKFVIKDKQERYLGFLDKEKTRKKFTNELYHFKDFNWKFFREIAESENVRDVILAQVNNKKSIKTCQVVSPNSKFDGKTLSVDEAIKNVVGEEAIILIFGNADIVYYQAEPFDGRYISI